MNWIARRCSDGRWMMRCSLKSQAEAACDMLHNETGETYQVYYHEPYFVERS